MERVRSGVTFAIGLALVSTLAVGPVAAQPGELETVVTFDVTAAELPEGVGVAGNGDGYVTLGPHSSCRTPAQVGSGRSRPMG